MNKFEIGNVPAYIAMLLVLTLASTSIVVAADSKSPERDNRGLELIVEMKRRASGFGDLTAKVEMELENRNGDRSVRHLSFSVLEDKGEGEKSLVVFLSPPDLNGTKFLSHNHQEKQDDQWLYLPALKRIKRLSSRDVSGSFMGSEFAYEDLSSQEVERYTYRFIAVDTANGLDCFVVERYPVSSESGYSMNTVWFDTSEYRVQRIYYYDRNSALLKRFTARDYRKYKNKYWRAHSMAMVNEQTGKSAILKWSDIVLGSGLRNDDFHKRVLKRDVR